VHTLHRLRILELRFCHPRIDEFQWFAGSMEENRRGERRERETLERDKTKRGCGSVVSLSFFSVLRELVGHPEIIHVTSTRCWICVDGGCSPP
jgi:hypothetical protein